jgi:hypothetical protein
MRQNRREKKTPIERFDTMAATANQEIAKFVLQQLGGSKFLAMTGAKDLVAIKNGLQFKLPRYAELKINVVRIVLNELDNYDVEFGSLRGLNYKVVSKHEGIYGDMLQELFTAQTGLDTHL